MDFSDAIPSTDEWYEALESLPTLGELAEGLGGDEVHKCPAYLFYAGGTDTLRRPGYPGEVSPPAPLAPGLDLPQPGHLVFGVYRRHKIELASPPGERVISIGCADENDIRLPDESVVATHAHLVREDDSFFLRPGLDAKLAPLRLNGAPVSQADKRGVPLRSFDQISLGEIELAFLLPADLKTLIDRMA